MIHPLQWVFYFVVASLAADWTSWYDTDEEDNRNGEQVSKPIRFSCYMPNFTCASDSEAEMTEVGLFSSSADETELAYCLDPSSSSTMSSWEYYLKPIAQEDQYIDSTYDPTLSAFDPSDWPFRGSETYTMLEGSLESILDYAGVYNEKDREKSWIQPAGASLSFFNKDLKMSPSDIIDDYDWNVSSDLCSSFTRRLFKLNQSYKPARPFFNEDRRMACKEDDFRVLKELANGGNGVVYKAKHLATNTLVALKHLTSIDDARRYPFARIEECLLSRAGDWPSIPKHYCTFIDKQGTIVIAMELITDAEELFHGIQKRHPLGEDAVRVIGMQLVSTVRYLHEMNIIFRDIKPENILVDFDSGKMHLVDFGLAVDPSRPVHLITNRLLGTPYYFAPEYLRPRRPSFVSKAADWYSVGLVLFEMTFGHGPFLDQSSTLESSIRNGFICEPLEGEPWTDVICDLIVRLCDIDPERRIGSKDKDFLNHPFFKDTMLDALLLRAHNLAINHHSINS